MKNGTYKAKSQGFHPAVTVTTTIENIDKLRKGDCMRLRQAEMKDFDRIIEILKDGKNQLAERGVDQWQGDYPSLDQIREDIEKGQAFLAVSQDNQTVGAICGQLLVVAIYWPYFRQTTNPELVFACFFTFDHAHNIWNGFVTEVVGTAVMMFVAIGLMPGFRLSAQF